MDSHDLQELAEKVDNLSRDVRDLVEAWNTARGMVRFVKFLGQIAVAIAAVWGVTQLGSHK